LTVSEKWGNERQPEPISDGTLERIKEILREIDRI